MFWVVYGTSTLRTTPGPELQIHCPACETVAAARSFESEDRITLYLIPLPRQLERHVVCNHCGTDWITDLPLSELTQLGAEAITSHLRHRPSFVFQALAALSVLLFWFPVIGLGLGIAGLIGNRKSRGLSYKLSLLGVVLTLLLWGSLFLRSALIEMKLL